MAEVLGKHVDDVFGPENGHLAKELERLFGAESAVAVQHQLRTVMAEQSARMREDLLKQFSSADAHNPLADFKAGTMAAMRRAAEQQDTNLKALNEQITALRGEVAKLQAEREKAQEVAAEHARSTAKGRPYEEAVFEAVEAIARARGDDADAVGDLPGGGGRKGDVVVGVDGCEGPPRARIVFEAKNAYVPKNKAVAELDAAMEQRDADYAVWVVPSDELLPGHGAQLREVNGDKLFVVFDPDDGGRLGLEVAYALARARTLMVSADAEALDFGALRTEVERALAAMDDVRRIKTQLTSATRRDRGRAPDPRRHGRARPRPSRAGRRARRGRHRRRHAAAGPPRRGLAQADPTLPGPLLGGIVGVMAGAGERQRRAGRSPARSRHQLRAAAQACRSFTAAPVRSTAPE